MLVQLLQDWSTGGVSYHTGDKVELDDTVGQQLVDENIAVWLPPTGDDDGANT